MTDQGLFAEISQGLAERLVAAGTRIRYPPGKYLFHAGEESHAAYIVEDGLLRVDRTTPSGKQVLVTLIRAGDLVGELSLIDQSRRSASCSVVTSARVLTLPDRAFTSLVESEPELANVITRRVVRRLRALTDQLVAASALDARERVAARICELMEVTGQHHDGMIDVTLPISQQDLAHWAGLSREGAVKGLKDLRDDGIIVTGRKRVTVLRPDALRELAQMAEL